MRPVIPGFVAFTLDSVRAIRDNRITQLVEGLERRDQKAKPKLRKQREIKLNATAMSALASLDPATQAMLRAAMKG